MSVTKVPAINGRQAKRRKLSHASSSEDTKVEDAQVDSSEGNSDENDEDLASDGSPIRQPAKLPRPPNKQPQQHAEVNGKGPVIATAAAGLSTSNMMLQAQSLLAEVKPDYDTKIRKMRPTAERIIDVIKAMQGQKPMSLAQAQSFARKTLKVAIPWTETPPSDIKYSFSFSQPTSVSLDGLLTHRMSTRGDARVAIVVEMPPETFQEKDYLNYRSFHKRAFYLACITSACHKEMSGDYDLNFGFLDDNQLAPVLQIAAKAAGKGVTGVVWEIIPTLPPSLGPIERTLPPNNCIRKDDLAARTNSDMTRSTPYYNSTLRSLASATSMKQILSAAAESVDHFRDACLLGTIWLQQRGLAGARAQGGFGPWEWSFMCALLLKAGGHQDRPLLSPRYSAIQLFKAMLQVLSGRDMYDPFVVRGSMKLDSVDQPTFFDAATGVNLLYKMTPWSYVQLKHHATVSLATANLKKQNGFDSICICKASGSSLQYDESYELDLPGSHTQVLDKLYNTLKTGLGDRVSMIDLQYETSGTWKITSPAQARTLRKVIIGISINADTTGRLVDHGPSVEDKDETKHFRDFWGEKAELRRFKDGRISESLVWSADTPVTQQIVQYVCTKHMNVAPGSISIPSVLEDIRLTSRLSASEAYTAVNSKFQSLSSTLHHLDTSQVPLPIRSVSAASEHLRSASLTTPLEPGNASPIDVIIQLDSSGRWPDELRAIQYTKIAFLTRIGDSLKTADRTLETRVGLENTSTSSLGTHNTSFLDVIYPSPSPSLPPIIFRLRIYHERETTLIQQSLSSKNTLSPPLRETYQSALHAQKQTLASTAHTTALRTLLTAHPPLSPTIRLLKSFIASHNLTPHIPPSILELIAANTFLNPAPWSKPGTATTAFARCLHFLARWDWAVEPLIVDLSLSQDMTLATRQDLETRSAAWRAMDPNMNSVAWFVGSSVDETGVVWTQGVGGGDPRPARVIAGRVRALATAALDVLKRRDEERRIMTRGDWEGIFAGSLEDFDFVLHLTSTKKGKMKNGKFKNLEIAETLDGDTTGIDIVDEYVKDLNRCFGAVAIFFYGGKDARSHAIGGLWRPHVSGRDAKPWKIRLGYSTVPVPMGDGVERDGEEADAPCKANFEGMLAEMGMMGEGIVERIVTRDG